MQGWAGFVLPLVVLLAFAYLLLIRPARKRASEMAALQSALSAGDEVMLGSGIFGTVTGFADDRVAVEVSPGVSIHVHRGAISKIIRDVPADAAGSSWASPTDPSSPAGGSLDDGNPDQNRGAI